MALMPLSLSLQVGDLYDFRTREELSPYHTHGQLEQGSRRRGSLYSYKDN